jgi:hypothetical protein
MSLRLVLPLAAAALACVPARPALRIESVATWRNDATAAYSLVHDDVCNDDTQGVFTHADPELTRRGLRGGFGVIVEQCQKNGRWPQVRTLLEHGHDVFSHSWSHLCLTEDAGIVQACPPEVPRSLDFAQQIDAAAAALKTNAGVGPDFFIFPFDACDPAAVAHLQALGYLGARCGLSGVNPPHFPDSFKINFDVWGPAYSTYWSAPVCAGVTRFETPPAQAPAACRTYVINHLVDEAIAVKGWASRELHGFDDDAGAWEPVPLADYVAHLDYVQARAQAGELWVEGPTSVLKYRWAREACARPTVSGRTLRFPAPAPACARHATVLSYLITTDADPAAISVQQAGSTLPGRKRGPGRFVIDADPTKGDAIVVY